MNHKFGSRSSIILGSCHPDLRRLMEKTISLSQVDFAIVQGVRTAEEQAILVLQKKSKTMKSKHLPCLMDPKTGVKLSGAVDIACYNHVGKLQWDGAEPLYHSVAAVVKAVSEELGIPIRWGGDWDRDGDTKDQTFNDLPHFELWDGKYQYDFSGLNV